MKDLKENQDRKYEESDANFSKVMTTAAGFIGVMVVGLLCAWAALAIFTSRTDAPDVSTETFTYPDSAGMPPGPKLEADPHESLVALRAREDSILNSYGWVDSAKGTARVPIRRAKELYREQSQRGEER